MANVFALYSVGSSIAKFLTDTYPQTEAGQMPICKFDLVSSSDLAGDIEEATRITLYIYRVTANEHARQIRPDHTANAKTASLGLDLHFLLSAWGGSAREELVTLAWAMRQLHLHPILDASSLTPEAEWAGDQIEIIPAELSTEDIVRIWDALEPAYRLSVPYIARVVRLDPDTEEEDRPVLALHSGFGTEAPR